MDDLRDPIQQGGDLFTIEVPDGAHVYVRRSSLILADGPFKMTSHFIAKRRFNVVGFFSGQTRWANRFDADGGPVTIMAGRDFHGRVLSLDVTPDTPVYIKPGLYLAHQGELEFNTERVAKKEFWTLTKIQGRGTVHIKLPGRAVHRALSDTRMVVDTNYVSAIRGTFEAHGKVFKTGELLKSGELENVHLSGNGDVVFQSENPEDAGGDDGGGILSSLFGWLPF